MNPEQFGRIIGRQLKFESVRGLGSRCYFENVMFAERAGTCGVVTTVIGSGPNQQRAREDFAQKIRGKVARVYDGLGAYREFLVPNTLTA